MICTVPPLTGLDPELPALAAGTNPAYVARLFASRPPRGAPSGTFVLGCERMHTEYEPGVRCRMSYRLQLGAPGVAPWPAFGGVLVRPVGLTMWWYADDPALPALRTAADPSSMRTRMASWAGAPLGDYTITPVRYRAGVRCLLRYEAATADGPWVFFGKLYGQDADRQARTQGALHAVLDAERRAGADCPAVARPVAYHCDLGLLVHAPVAGPLLRALVVDASLPPATRLRALHGAGAQLAAFHASAGVPAPLRLLADDLAELRTYGAAVARADHVLAERFAFTTDLAGRGPCGGSALAPAHGALRTDQLVASPRGIVLLDLDTAAWAEPSRDVGNLLAYLAWRALRRPAERAFLAQARAAFLAGYRDRSPDLDERLLNRNEALALLRIAGRRFRALRYDEWPLVPDLVELAAATLPRRRRGSAPGTPVLVSALRSIMDPARMTAELRALPLRRDGLNRPTVRCAELLAYRAKRTAVVRYRLANGHGRDQVVLGKLYPDPAAATRADAVLSVLAGVLTDAAGGRVIPEPVGVLPPLALVLFLPVEGRFLDELLGGKDAGGAEGAESAVRAAACWLARLHGSSAVLDRRLDRQDERANIRAWAQAIDVNLPGASQPAQALSARLEAALGALRVRHDVPIHKDFHYQHVLVGSRVAVIDLDEARMGDPSLDVAHFCVCLDLLALRSAFRVTEVQQAFLEEYAARSGWAPDPAYQIFAAWTCLKIARQLATGRGPRPRPVGRQRLDQARHMLARGLSWLN